MEDPFINCQTEEEAKKMYRKYCFKYHPDKGGTNADMIELTEYYKNWYNSQSKFSGDHQKAESAFWKSYQEFTQTKEFEQIAKILQEKYGLNIIDLAKGANTILRLFL